MVEVDPADAISFSQGPGIGTPAARVAPAYYSPTAWQAATCRGPASREHRIVAETTFGDPEPLRLAIADERAAGVEPAAERDALRVGRLALEDLLLHTAGLGHDRQQRARVRMLRRLEDLFGRAELDDATEVHHRDAVGDVPREPEIVGDDEDRDAGLVDEPAHELQDLAPHRRVEARHRLVGDEQAWLEHHCARDHHALPLTAGHLVRVEPDEPFGRPEPRAGERPRDELLLVAALLVHAQAFGDGLVDRLPRVERAGRVLEDHLDVAAVLVQAGAAATEDRPALVADFAVHRLLEPHDRARRASSCHSPTRRRARRPRPRARRGSRRRPRAGACRRAARPCAPKCTCRSSTSSKSRRSQVALAALAARGAMGRAGCPARFARGEPRADVHRTGHASPRHRCATYTGGAAVGAGGAEQDVESTRSGPRRRRSAGGTGSRRMCCGSGGSPSSPDGRIA